MKGIFGFKTVCALALALAIFIGAESVFAKPWSFGVMSDTQWTAPTDPANQNPNAVAVSIIKQINQQVINPGVKFVIQMGDLTENGNDAAIAVQGGAAQSLYDHGIGFFPMRGNHETYGSPAKSDGIPAVQSNFPQTQGIGNTFGTANFNSSTSVSSDLNGHEFLVAQGETYTTVADSFEATIARILGGRNGSSEQDYNARPLTKTVNTGWTDGATWRNVFVQRWFKKPEFDFASNVLTLWGMADLGSDHTDVYTLSMTYV
jgi:hypothetical protein